MNNSLDKIYIVHYKPLTDRKEYLENEIPKRFGFDNVEFVISDKISDNEILKNNDYVSPNNFFNRRLSNAEICNYTVQYKIWKKIYENKLNNVLVIEDDAIFNKNYDNFFPRLVENLPLDYDLCFISECCNLQTNNSNLFSESSYSRCCVAYFITKNACEKLISIKNFYYPVDEHLNFVKNDLNLKYYWSNPTVFNQGSEYIYNSNANRNI